MSNKTFVALISVAMGLNALMLCVGVRELRRKYDGTFALVVGMSAGAELLGIKLLWAVGQEVRQTPAH